eukprot:13496681-Alexandrium_andersonii.AAC.1
MAAVAGEMQLKACRMAQAVRAVCFRAAAGDREVVMPQLAKASCCPRRSRSAVPSCCLLRGICALLRAGEGTASVSSPGERGRQAAATRCGGAAVCKEDAVPEEERAGGRPAAAGRVTARRVGRAADGRTL